MAGYWGKKNRLFCKCFLKPSFGHHTSLQQVVWTDRLIWSPSELATNTARLVEFTGIAVDKMNPDSSVDFRNMIVIEVQSWKTWVLMTYVWETNPYLDVGENCCKLFSIICSKLFYVLFFYSGPLINWSWLSGRIYYNMSFGYVDWLDFKTFCFTECMWLISEILPLGSLFTNVFFSFLEM